MIIRSYALLIFIYDLISLLFHAYLAILSSIFRVFVPNKPRKVWNEIVMIVGSSRGVGREIALQISRIGATVLCLDMNENDNQILVQDIRQQGGTAYSLLCDVTSKEQVDRIIERVENEIGNITMLFHCCSVPSPRSLVNEPPPLRRTMDVSVTSYFYVSILTISLIYQLTFHTLWLFKYLSIFVC
jgi:short-subunit dehydrogenase involved in D-alanine esterification of teichoic acids